MSNGESLVTHPKYTKDQKLRNIVMKIAKDIRKVIEHLFCCLLLFVYLTPFVYHNWFSFYKILETIYTKENNANQWLFIFSIFSICPKGKK